MNLTIVKISHINVLFEAAKNIWSGGYSGACRTRAYATFKKKIGLIGAVVLEI